MVEQRCVNLERITNETNINLTVNLDGVGNYKIATGIGFFDHMLELFAKHANIDLQLKTTSDLRVDEHHTVEDIGIVLGAAIKQALGDKCGIERYGFLLPMDESLVEVALDLGGRGYLVWNVKFRRAIFKAFAHALRMAIRRDAGNLSQLPSTKGCL